MSTPSEAIRAAQNAHASLANTDDDGLYPFAGDLLTLRAACAALVDAIDSRTCIRQAHRERCEHDPYYAYQHRGLR